VVAALAVVTLVAACGPAPGDGPGSPGTPRFERVFASNPLVPTSSFVGAQRAISADFSRAAVLIQPPSGSWATQVGVWERSTGEIRQLTELDSTTFAVGQPFISADGSKVFFQHMYSRLDPQDVDSLEVAVMRIDVATGEIDPIGFGRSPGITSYSVSGDGNTVVAEVGRAVKAWKDGVLTTLSTGTGSNDGIQYSVDRQSVSTDGRFAAIATSTPIDANTQQVGLMVVDLELGTVRASWTGPTRPWNPQMAASPLEFLMRIASTLDDGSVLFTQGVDGPLLRLDGTTGATAPTAVTEAFAEAGSANGRHVLFRGSAAIDHRAQTLDLLSDAVADAHLDTVAGGNWTSVGVSDDGRWILVHGSDLDHMDGYYLWDRT
jgi:hypothetical protein